MVNALCFDRSVRSAIAPEDLVSSSFVRWAAIRSERLSPLDSRLIHLSTLRSVSVGFLHVAGHILPLRWLEISEKLICVAVISFPLAISGLVSSAPLVLFLLFACSESLSTGSSRLSPSRFCVERDSDTSL